VIKYKHPSAPAHCRIAQLSPYSRTLFWAYAQSHGRWCTDLRIACQLARVQVSRSDLGHIFIFRLLTFFIQEGSVFISDNKKINTLLTAFNI